MLGASQIALIGSAFAAVTYDELVDTFRVDGVSYWKFANHDGADVWGTEHATYKTLPSEGPVATIVDLDTIAEGAPADGTCTAWTGALESYADAAHNAAHKTAEGTIVVSFQLDTLSRSRRWWRPMPTALPAGCRWRCRPTALRGAFCGGRATARA